MQTFSPNFSSQELGEYNMKKESTVTVDVVAAFLDCDKRTVQNYAKDGIIPRAGHGKYNLLDCIRSYVRYLRNKETELEIDDLEKKIRQAEFELKQNGATKLRLENEAKSGYLIKADDVEPFFQGVLVTLRQQLLSLGDVIANEVLSCDTEIEIAQAIRHAIEGVLDEVSRADLRFSEDSTFDASSEYVGEGEGFTSASSKDDS
jgi:phage terminase Nu1 subunit (DNA packaging protein)